MDEKTNIRSKPGQVAPKATEGDLDLAHFFSIIWTSRYFITICTTVTIILGVIYAFLATPVYYSHATITLKDAGKGVGASGILSQLGGVGGMVSSQLGLNNTSLDKMEVILRGHELAEAVITNNDLLPILFHKLWNARTKSWKTKDESEIPTLRGGEKVLRENVLSVSLDLKKGMINFGVNLYDSLLAKNIVDYYLVELNRKIHDDVIRESETNQEFLNKQLNNAVDPILREKILEIIGMEIEKSMLATSQSFEILDKPVVPMERSKPQRKSVVIVSFLLGVILSISIVFLRRIARDIISSIVRSHALEA